MELGREAFCLPFSLIFIWMTYLPKLLNSCGTGCRVGDTIVNHLMYEDDPVILCPFMLVFNSYKGFVPNTRLIS